MWKTTFSGAICLFVWQVAGGGCAAPGRLSETNVVIRNVLERQAAAWNAGDLEAFMAPYWHSSKLTFSSGGRVTRGWSATLANFRRRYPTREAMGRLTLVGDLEITELGKDAALVLGRWRLERDEPLGGVFTLVLRKQAGRWVIVHDHTSRDTP